MTERKTMDLSVNIGKTKFKNPIWVASGTFGYGKEFEDFFSIEELGAIVTKTVTLNARIGNRSPRIVETPSGLINSIGLENKGVDLFIREAGDFLKNIKTKVVVSVAGNSEEEIKKCIQRLDKENFVDAIEVNLSCPNVAHKQTKYRLIAQDPQLTEKMISKIKKATKRPVIAKLTPNVTDIAVIAKAAERAGADAVSLVNTYLAMAVCAKEGKALLGNIVGGLSGPAIKPMALRAVWETYASIKIPIIGMGGIVSGTDVAEFMLCGAKAVQIGTTNFIDPASGRRVLKEFKEYLKGKNIRKARTLVGKLKKE